jgi:hypothetical protein
MLLSLGGLTALALAARERPAEAGMAAAAGGALAAVALALRAPRVRKLRLAASYAFIAWFYFSVPRITPALGFPLRDDALLAADEALFGVTPAVGLGRWATPWLTDLLSACYASYLVYLHGALLYALARPVGEADRLAGSLFPAFAVGLAGYLLVPAVGPGAAFPELFPAPLRGGLLTRLNAALVASGSARYDVFPSLHVLITCTLLDHDRRWARRRFRLVLLPAAGMVLAAVYLRYHYAVDLLAGFAAFVAVRAWVAPRDAAG